jgi:hypothetical protein
MRACMEMGLVKAVVEGPKTAMELETITKCDKLLIGTGFLQIKRPYARADNISSYLETTLLYGSIL